MARARSRADAPSRERHRFHGAYALASYLLTGEHRRWRRADARFDRLLPRRPLYPGRHGAIGAWELAARFSWLDLDTGAIAGGRLATATLGITWYLNANAKIMANWVRAHLRGIDVSDILQLRFHLSF